MSLTADQILSIKTPEKLFTVGMLSEVKAQYLELSKKWHPDKRPGVDPRVFATIGDMYLRALKKIKDNAWGAHGSIEIESADGKKYRARYRHHRKFELGDLYIGDTVIAYLLDNSAQDLADAEAAAVKGFVFSKNDPKMEADLSKVLPRAMIRTPTADGRIFVAYAKTAEWLSMRDIIRHFGGKVPPKHAAWMISRLYNLARYLDYTGLMHGDLSPETLFIHPQDHGVAIFGGWWYSRPIGKKMSALPSRTIRYAPKAVVEAKVASQRIDLECIKATGRELLGDISGARLMSDKEIPKPLFNWLQTPSQGDPKKDLKAWTERVLPDSFGPRKFIELKINVEDLYTP